MRWIQIGESTHVVLRKNNGKTLCGLNLARISSIVVSPPFEERCGNCDRRWREIGRRAKPKRVVNVDASSYSPRFTFADFEGDV